jgi:hypothetical protein
MAERHSDRPPWLVTGRRGERVVEVTLAVVFLTLLVYALLEWLQVRGDTRSYRPLPLALVAAAMMLQPVAALIRHRSRAAFYLALGIIRHSSGRKHGRASVGPDAFGINALTPHLTDRGITYVEAVEQTVLK